MTGLAAERSPLTRTVDEFQDLADWGESTDFVGSVYKAVAEISFTCPGGAEGASARVFLTLLTYSYGRGLYSAQEIVDAAAEDPNIRYICVGQIPEVAELRAFRRNNKAVLVTALSNLALELSPSLLSRPDAMRVAWTRVRRSIQADSIDLDA